MLALLPAPLPPCWPVPCAIRVSIRVPTPPPPASRAQSINLHLSILAGQQLLHHVDGRRKGDILDPFVKVCGLYPMRVRCPMPLQGQQGDLRGAWGGGGGWHGGPAKEWRGGGVGVGLGWVVARTGGGSPRPMCLSLTGTTGPYPGCLVSQPHNC